MKKNLLKVFPFLAAFLVLFLLPFLAFAQTSSCGATGDIKYIICTVSNTVDSLIPIAISLAILYFIWGIIRYVIAGGEEAKKNGRDTIIYGIIGLVCIFGLWGIIAFINNTFGIDTNAVAPTFQPIGGGTTIGTGCVAPGSSDANSRLQDYLGYIVCVINNTIIPLIFTVAVLMFIWGTVKFFLINAGEEEQRSEGKRFMIWGIVALAAMLSVWGLVNILGSTFGINTSVIPKVCPPGDSSDACR